MISFLKAHKFGCMAIGWVMMGVIGLIVPTYLHWNSWIYVFYFAKYFFYIPIVLGIVGLFLDHTLRLPIKLPALIGIFLPIAFLFMGGAFPIVRSIPRDIKMMGTRQQEKPRPTHMCVVNQSGVDLEDIKFYVNGAGLGREPRHKGHRKMWKTNEQPIKDTKNIKFTFDARFVDDSQVNGLEVETERNGLYLTWVTIYIHSDKTISARSFH